MLGRVVTGGIILFWLAMMGLLAKREILPGLEMVREMAHTPNYQQLEARAAQPRTDQMGIYLGEQRIGQSVSTVLRQENEVQIRNRTDVKLSMGPVIPFLSKFTGVDVHLKFRARVFEGRLLDFNLVLTLGKGEPYAVVDGYPVGNELTLRIRQGGQVRTQTIPFDSRQVISTDLMPAFTPAELRVGATWTMRSMDLQTMAMRKSLATVRRREQVKIGGRMRDAFVIEIPYGPAGGESFTVWASPDGEVLMQKFFGFRFEREEPTKNEDAESHD